MGLSTGYGSGNLFTEKWRDYFSPVVDRGHNGKATIFSLEDPDVDIISGNVRIQPVRSSVYFKHLDADTTAQVVLISFNHETVGDYDVRPKHRIEVTECELNTVNTKFYYSLQEVMDSGNPLERTFYCQVDTEVVNDSA